MAKKGDLLAGYDCSFVRLLPSDLQSECSICLYVLREPYLVGCCGYRFCRTCIEPIQNQPRRKCPLCNQQNFSSLPDKQLERILNDKLVYCANKSGGCSWNGRLAELETHLNPPAKKGGCLLAKVQCYHCKELVLRSSIRTHAQKCKKVTCSHCKTYEDMASKMEKHYGECPMYPVACPNSCGSEPFRKNITKHVADSCPLTLLECPYSYAGCDVKVTRREMSSHGSMEDHLISAAIKIKDLESENASLKAQLRFQERVKWSSALKSIRYLKVTNLPPTVNKQMLKCVFGQHGSVEDIQLHGHHTAEVKYEDEESAETALSHSKENGIKLKSFQLTIDPVYH